MLYQLRARLPMVKEWSIRVQQITGTDLSRTPVERATRKLLRSCPFEEVCAAVALAGVDPDYSVAFSNTDSWW